jgi:hypothetical protein
MADDGMELARTMIDRMDHPPPLRWAGADDGKMGNAVIRAATDREQSWEKT